MELFTGHLLRIQFFLLLVYVADASDDIDGDDDATNDGRVSSDHWPVHSATQNVGYQGSQEPPFGFHQTFSSLYPNQGTLYGSNELPPIPGSFGTPFVNQPDYWNPQTQNIPHENTFSPSQYFVGDTSSNTQGVFNLHPTFGNLQVDYPTPSQYGQHEESNAPDDSHLSAVVAGSSGQSASASQYNPRWTTDDSNIFAVVAGSQNAALSSSRQSDRTRQSGPVSEYIPRSITDDSNIFAVTAGSGKWSTPSEFSSGFPTDDYSLSAVVGESGRHSAQQLEYGSYFPGSNSVVAASSSNPSFDPYGPPVESYDESQGYNSGNPDFYGDLYAQDDSYLGAVVTNRAGQSEQYAYGGEPSFPQHTAAAEDALPTDPALFEHGRHGYVSDFYQEIPRGKENIAEASASNEYTSDCIIRIRQLPKKHGLLMMCGKIVYPSSEDKVRIPERSQISVVCLDGNSLKLHTDMRLTSELELICIGNILRHYMIENEGLTVLREADWNEFECEDLPKYKLRHTDSAECGVDKSLYRVGFANFSAPLFHVLYNLCIDRHNADRVLYTWNYLDRTVQGRETFDLVEKYMAPNARYTKTFIDKTLREQVLDPVWLELTRNGDISVTPGHLTSKLDFVYRSEQNGSFHYVNVHAMWSNLRKQWDKLEIAVANFAGTRNDRLTIYTGVSEYQEARNQFGNLTTLYHYIRLKKTAGHFAKYFWKIVHSEKFGQCVIIVGNNSATPFPKKCFDVTATVPWLREAELDTRILYACNCYHFRPEELHESVQFKRREG